MATPSNSDRLRAYRLRKQKKPLTPPDKSWLATYEASTLRGTIAAAKAKAAEDATPASPGVHVHTTVKLDDVLDPMMFTWLPEVPASSADADAAPAPPGAPPQPEAGTPLVDPAPAPAPVGDARAAAQFAMIIVGITGWGIKSALELSEDYPVPEAWRELASSPENIAKALQIVGGSAHALAVKHNFKEIPMADEVVVGASVAGSVLAGWLNWKRKHKKPKTPEEAAKQEQAKVRLRSVPKGMEPDPAPSSPEGLWR